MCLFLYLATESAVPEQDGAPWARLDVRRLPVADPPDPDQSLLEMAFPERAVYLLGSHTGCGCGWNAYLDLDDAETRHATLDDRDALAALLRALPGAPVLVAAWSGSLAEPRERRTVTRADVESLRFRFEDATEYEVVGADEGGVARPPPVV